VGVSKSWALRLGLSAVVAYLAVHAIGGRHGLASLMSLKERQAALTQELAQLRAENAALEDRVRLLATHGHDRATLAAAARAALGYGPAGGLLAEAVSPPATAAAAPGPDTQRPG
jgi:cell division protein FtsB